MSAALAAMLQEGLRALSLLVLLTLAALAALDFVAELTRSRSLGQRFQTWSRRFPLYAFLLILIVGALLSHFFWQEATRSVGR